MTLETIGNNGFKLLLHSPYSLNLGLSDYHLLHIVTICEVPEWTSTAATSLGLHSAGRNAWIMQENLNKIDITYPHTTDSMFYFMYNCSSAQ
jgi:hypothetical protein